jgi:transposase
VRRRSGPWSRPWLRVLRIRRHSDQDATSQPGSGWCQSSIRAGKEKLGSISKQGDRYLRSLFSAGALAVIRYAKIYGTAHRPWLTALLARRPTKVAAIALANKLARMAWAMMTKV